MTFHPLFVPGGVYLRTSTGELIGQLDNAGAPFETLDEAREKADWLDMVVQFQQSQRHPAGHQPLATGPYQRALLG